jgi:hypothetical protein
MLGIAHVAADAGRLLGAKRKEMSRPSMIEPQQRSGGGPGPEGATHAMGAARGRRKCVGTERIAQARRHVIAEHDRPEQAFAACMLALAHRQCGRNDGAARMGTRGSVGIVGFVGVRQHAVGEGRMDRSGEPAGPDNRRSGHAAKAAHIGDGQPPGTKLRARDHGRHGIEDMLARLFDDGLRKRSRENVSHVGAELTRDFADFPQRLDHQNSPPIRSIECLIGIFCKDDQTTSAPAAREPNMRLPTAGTGF